MGTSIIFRTLRMTIVLAMSCIAPTAEAVYRCTIGGKITYSDTPCPIGAEGGHVRLFSGGPSEEDAARAQERLEKMRADTIELRTRQEAQRAAAADDRVSKYEAEKAAKRKSCADLRAKRNDADYWATEFRHPDNIRREQEKAAYARERLWWDCQNVD